MFGSKAQKEEKDYRYLSDILKSSNMDTEEKVESHLKKVMSRALLATLALVIFIAVMCFVSPKYAPIWGIVGVMCFAWIWRSAVVARRIMRRYIKEEIGKENEVLDKQSDTPDKPDQTPEK